MSARLLSLTHDEYLAHPGFSASTAKRLLSKSELHAKEQRDAPTDLMDRGAVIHAMILGTGAQYACLPFDNWTTKAARQSRDATRAAGLIPLTHIAHTEYETAALEIRRRLDGAGHHMTTGRSEITIEWTETVGDVDVLCKCRMDHLDIERGVIDEIKIVDDANPERIERSAENMGYRVSAAAYVRALIALRPQLMGSVVYQFLFCEPEPPYALYDPEPDHHFLDGGDRDWTRALVRWARCKATGIYPDYGDVRYISRPTWALRREGYTTDE